MSRADTINTAEILEIHNFLSLKEVVLDVKNFNIITGGMGSGKSVCIKLLAFFEDIFTDIFVLPYSNFLECLNASTLYKKLEDKFKNIFHYNNIRFSIKYSFTNEENTFEIHVEKSEKGGIIFKSSFLESTLSEWKEVLKSTTKPDTPDGFQEKKLSLLNELSKKFGGKFPVATIFIPASRAALAIDSTSDQYLNQFNDLINFIKTLPEAHTEKINKILKAKIEGTGKIIKLKSEDGRVVPLSKASSGQQEIIYVLMLIDKLENLAYTYGKQVSIFIEEPSAHLFPVEQKQIIVSIFNSLKESKKSAPTRFFITTHSPYVLNVVNNILKKDSLYQKYVNEPGKISELDELDFPSISQNDISAYFIEKSVEVVSILEKDGDNNKFIYAGKIEEITQCRNDDFNALSDIEK